MKLIGAVLVAGGCTALGLSKGMELHRRLRTLDELNQGLFLLEGELALCCPPLPRLMEQLARRSPGAAGQLFARCARGLEELEDRPFARQWQEGVEGISDLMPEGKQALLPLGAVLGRYREEEQRGAVAAVRQQLAEVRRRLEEQSSSQIRLWRTMGVSAGISLVILLI